MVPPIYRDSNRIFYYCQSIFLLLISEWLYPGSLPNLEPWQVMTTATGALWGISICWAATFRSSVFRFDQPDGLATGSTILGSEIEAGVTDRRDLSCDLC